VSEKKEHFIPFKIINTLKHNITYCFEKKKRTKIKINLKEIEKNTESKLKKE